MKLGIEGLQEAQRDNEMRIQALRPGGKSHRAVREALQAAFRYVLSITHVFIFKGGGLRASHRMIYTTTPNRGIIEIDQSAVNPRGQRPYLYGPKEHARGGDHAFYKRTEDEAGAGIAREFEAIMREEMKV
jgi:hypothetical protein